MNARRSCSQQEARSVLVGLEVEEVGRMSERHEKRTPEMVVRSCPCREVRPKKEAINAPCIACIRERSASSTPYMTCKGAPVQPENVDAAGMACIGPASSADLDPICSPEAVR